MSHKWTEGEVRRYVEDREKDAAFEVLNRARRASSGIG